MASLVYNNSNNNNNNNNNVNNNNQQYIGCKYCKSTGERYRHSVFVPCRICNGRGIVMVDSSSSPFEPKQAPVVGIIGGGISGMALGLSLQHRNIPYIIFEKDPAFNSRCQGYGLTMQQGGRILQKMGIENFQQYGATTIKHVSFLPDGTVLGSYGDKRKQRHAKKQKLNNNNNNNSNNNGNMEKQQASSASDDVSHTNNTKSTTTNKGKRFNVMLPRQDLRRMIYEKLDKNMVKWGQKFVRYEKNAITGKIILTLEENNNVQTNKINNTIVVEVDLLVGADGIWSKVRMHSTSPSKYLKPRYLGVMVILGRAETK